MLRGFCEHCIKYGTMSEESNDQTVQEEFLQGLTSMMAVWIFGFWNATATSGFAIIFDTTSSGVMPTCAVQAMK